MDLNRTFSNFATRTSKATGSPAAFLACVLLVLGWALSGPVFKFSETWQLVINTGTTIIMVFTANSGVGLEALIHGRPVVVSGDCEYAYAAARVRDAADLARAIDEAKQMTQRGLEFLYFYTHRYAFNASDTDRLEQRVDDWLDLPLITP